MKRKNDTFAEMPMDTEIKPVFIGTKIVVPEINQM